MTTSKAVHHKDRKAFRALLTAPAVQAATKAAASSIVGKIEASWPDGARKPAVPGVPVIEVRSYRMADGRPAEWVMINHPYAVAHEAKTGFVTKSIGASGLRISR